MRNLKAAAAGLALFGLTSGPGVAAEFTIDVSLDTSPSHIRNESFVKFAEEVNARSGGRLEMRVFHGASKYKGTHVATALAQGALDMGAPAQQHISKFVPEAGVLLLPMFYGVNLDVIYKVMDSPLGDELNKRIEDKLGVKVLGRHFDLGFGTVFTTDKPIIEPEDMDGMKIRVPGGAATLERYRVFGASPVKISWPDVPQALQRGTVSAIWSTHESNRSAKLWDAGIRYAFDDRQAIVQYVPMLSKKAWDDLPGDLRKLLSTTWEETIDEVRGVAQGRQARARRIGLAHGVTAVEPSQKALTAMRGKLLAAQPKIVDELKMDADYIARVHAAVKAARAAQ